MKRTCENCIHLFEEDDEPHALQVLDGFAHHIDICEDAYSLKEDYCDRWEWNGEGDEPG